MIQALIFDFDGLILDTETSEYQSWQEVYSAYGCHLPLERWVTAVGGSLAQHFDPYAFLAEQSGQLIDADAIRPTRRQRHLDLIAEQPVLPGVLDYIAAARKMGIKVGLASSSSYDWVGGHLTRLGLLDAFETIKTSDDVENVKPDPALYLAAAAALGVDPRRALALEDSGHGLNAAKAAGMYCVVVPNSVTTHLSFDGADRRLNSLADVSLAELIEGLG
ncbi:MAG: HAD family hydrolase [Caldilineaceae bacterium]